MGKTTPKEKVPELYAAKRALIAYLKKHNIDPSDTKRIQTDSELKDLVYKLNKERDKVMLSYPALDKSNNIKLLKMAKEEKKAKKAKKVEEVKASKTEKKQGRAVTKYDYPQVKDEKTGKMREMTKDEKKKYRVEQRKLASGGTSTKSKSEKPVKEAPVVDNKKKAKKENKTKTTKKAKKVKKEED